MSSVFAKIAIPSIFTNLLGFLVVVTNTIFSGHMDDPTKLAVVGLCSVICNVFVLSITLGINSAQETLTSQAFGA